MTKVLVLRLSAIGDVVHTLPAVHLLKKHLPGCSITWVVEESAADLIAGYAGIDAVIVSRRTAWARALRKGDTGEALTEAIAFLRELRRDKYDLVLDFQGLFKSGVLAGLARGKRKIGFASAREGAAFFYTHYAPAPDFNDHAIVRHMGLLRYLGINDAAVAFSPLWGASDEESIHRLLGGHQAQDSSPLIMVHPSAAWPTKCWDAGKMAMVCDSLRRMYGASIVFAGAAAEQKQVSSIIAGMAEPARSLAGCTTLRELACLIARSSLMVAMDSGPMHLASAVGTPVVALFGPTAPWRTGPFGSRHSVIRKELACSPCYKKKKCPQGHHRCMADITVEEVLQACSLYLCPAT
jgi:heptosyltransferase I